MSTHQRWDEGSGRRVLLVGLAALWLLDTVLQAQPSMFSQHAIPYLWSPVAEGAPRWLAALVLWAIGVARPWWPRFNALLIGAQLGVGLALLLTRRPVPRRLALWASLMLASAVWVFGEGMGGLFSGGETLLAGTPGSALVYAAASALLLLPADSWIRARARWGMTPAAALLVLLLAAGSVWQLAPAYWTPLGLSGVPAMPFMMPQPGVLRDLLGAASGLALRDPVTLNALIVVSLASAALALAVAGERRLVLAGVLLLMAVIWLVGQDAGMLFSRAATDPNTMPVMALLLTAHWAGLSHPAAARRPAPVSRRLPPPVGATAAHHW